MSDPIDARVFREMVRELASEDPRPVDWEHAEEKLFARLESPISGDERRWDALDESGPDEEDLGLMCGGEGETEGDRISEVGLGLPQMGLPELDLPGLAEVAGSSGSDGDRVSSPYVAARVASTIHVPPVGKLFAVGNEPDQAASELLRAPSKVRRWSAVLAFVAVAASVAFILGGLVTGGTSPKGSLATATNAPEITAERWVDAADVPMAPGSSGAHDLGALRSGDMVEATSDAVSFAEADKVSWTISPGSRVVVRTGVDSARHVLVLESGSIRADVLAATNGIADPFVVEAGETRVAVQGTIFSVTRSTKGIVVDVEHGFVVVGPRGEVGLGSGRLLHESERASFSLDGGLTFKPLTPERTAMLSSDDSSPNFKPAEGNSSPESVSSPKTIPQNVIPQNVIRQNGDTARKDGSNSEPVATPSPAPTALAPNDPVLTEASIKASLDRCFAQVEAQKREGSKDDAVSVTVRSTLSLRVADDGAIKSAAFNPPLRPDLQSCAVSLLSAHVDRGARTLQIPVEIRH